MNRLGMRFRALGCALALLGCESSVAIDRQPAPPPWLPAPGMLAPGTTAPGPGVDDEEPTAATLCPTSELGGGEPLFGLTVADSATIVDADGAVIPLDVGTAPPDATAYATLQGAADRAVTALNWTEPGLVHQSVLTMFDTEGNIVKRVHGPGVDVSIRGMSPSGDAWLYRYVPGVMTEHFVLTRDGVERKIDNFTPVRFTGEGDLLGANGNPGWMAVQTGEVSTAARFDGALLIAPWRDGYLVLKAGDSAPWLYRVERQSEVRLVLFDVPSEAEELAIIGGAGDHILMADTGDGRRWRVSTIDGSAVVIDGISPLGPPPTSMGSCAPEVVLASDGDLLFGSGQSELSFQKVDPLGGAWSVLGAPLTGVELVQAWEKDGTFYIDGVVGTFCPGPIGGDAPSPTAIPGRSLQIVRPATGAQAVVTNLSMFTSQVDIRDGGECVLYGADDGVHLVDLVSGQDALVGEAGAFSWWQD